MQSTGTETVFGTKTVGRYGCTQDSEELCLCTTGCQCSTAGLPMQSQEGDSLRYEDGGPEWLHPGRRKLCLFNETCQTFTFDSTTTPTLLPRRPTPCFTTLFCCPPHRRRAAPTVRAKKRVSLPHLQRWGRTGNHPAASAVAAVLVDLVLMRTSTITAALLQLQLLQLCLSTSFSCAPATSTAASQQPPGQLYGSSPGAPAAVEHLLRLQRCGDSTTASTNQPLTVAPTVIR